MLCSLAGLNFTCRVMVRMFWRVGRDGVGVHAAGGLERGHLEGLAEALEAVAQDVQRALGGQFLGQRVEQHGLGCLALQVDEGLPLLGLRGLDVGETSAGNRPSVGVDSRLGSPLV